MIPDFVAIDVADVYKRGVLAATLRRLPSSVELRYDLDYVHNVRVAIATTLPLSEEPIVTPARSVAPYFAGLLPEGRRLTALRSALKTSADDDFSMLLAVGADPVGDVQIVVHGEPCPPFGDGDGSGQGGVDGRAGGSADGNLGSESISFAELFSRATGVAPDQVGIAGVQDKVSGRMVSFPIRQFSGPGSILKFDPPEFAHLVRNEAFFLTMAAACGIDTVRWKVVVDRDGRDGLLITRFDRFVTEDGSVGAYAVEDGCQVSDRYPADKYALSTEAVINALSARCAASKVAALRFYRQFLFAVITGNGDQHAKNFSLVFHGREWLPSPAYDLPSSAPYGDHTLALAVHGSREGQVSRKRALVLAAALGLPTRSAVLMMDELVAQCLPWADRLTELPFDPRRRRHLETLIRNRCRLLNT